MLKQTYNVISAIERERNQDTDTEYKKSERKDIEKKKQR